MSKSVKKPAKRLIRKVENADAAVSEAALPHRQAPLVRLLSFVGDAGDQPPMRVLCGAVIAAGLIAGSRRLTRAGTHMLLAHSVATEAKSLLKHNVDRTRPRSRRQGSDGHRFSAGDKGSKEEMSFPSGHSAGAVAVARAFARHYPEHEKAALAAAGVIALAQIPRCAHYPSDVAAGVAIGVAAEAVTTLLPDIPPRD